MPGIHKGSGWLTYAAGTRPTRMKMTPRAHARPGRPWTPPRTQFRDMAAHPVGRWKQCLTLGRTGLLVKRPILQIRWIELHPRDEAANPRRLREYQKKGKCTDTHGEHVAATK